MSGIDPHTNFGTMECPGCGVKVKRNQNFCPICKYQFAHPSAKKQRVIVIVVVIMLLLLLVSSL